MGEPYSWTSGPYLVTAIDSHGLKTTMKFEYSASITTTTTQYHHRYHRYHDRTAGYDPDHDSDRHDQRPNYGHSDNDDHPIPHGCDRDPDRHRTRVHRNQHPDHHKHIDPDRHRTRVHRDNTATSTVTQTTSAIPGWAYGVMVVLLLVGLAIGYVVKRPSVKQS